MAGLKTIFIADSERGWDDAGPGVRRKILGYEPSLMIARVAFEAGAVGAPHSHPHIQCGLIESGVFDVTISGETRRLAKGDCFLVPADALHGVVAVEAGVIVDTFSPMRADFVPA